MPSEKPSKPFKSIARHFEIEVFSQPGSTELVVYPPSFATDEDRQEFSLRLTALGRAIDHPFVQSDPAATPISLKVQADDAHTIGVLAGAKKKLKD